MKLIRHNTLTTLFLIILFTLLFSSCSNTIENNSVNSNHFTIDPILREYYLELGGEKILGQPISDIILWHNNKCQYSVSALLCFDEDVKGEGRYFIAPIGEEIGFNIIEPTATTSADNDIELTENIFPPFEYFFNQYRQTYDIGSAISSIQYNVTQKRTEQYFERIGLMVSFNESSKQASLIPYGALHCGDKCNYDLDPLFKKLDNSQILNAPFATTLEEYGGIPIFGKPLYGPYIASDGSREQVFENIILYKEPGTENQVLFRPAPTILNMISSPPGQKSMGSKDNVIFYTTQEELGYHVPVVFDEFIENHGGIHISGNPISETIIYDGETVARQCFENYCLDYDHNAEPDNSIHMASLGILYMDNFIANNSIIKNLDRDNLQINIETQKDTITNFENQEILIKIISVDQNIPIQDIALKIILRYSENGKEIFYPKLTDINGISNFYIPPLTDIEDGTDIKINACMNIETFDPICEQVSLELISE